VVFVAIGVVVTFVVVNFVAAFVVAAFIVAAFVVAAFVVAAFVVAALIVAFPLVDAFFTLGVLVFPRVELCRVVLAEVELKKCVRTNNLNDSVGNSPLRCLRLN
jgi:energy-coupling factor transporter transmembrane protein EcfT